MVSFSFALILFIIIDVNGQNIDFNALSSNIFGKDARFGQVQQIIDNQKPVSLRFDFSLFNRDEPITCFRVRANIKQAHPTDNTKYYICRDKSRHEVFTCPNGGIFDDKQKACIDLCEQRKPCLNKGQCIILSNLTLQCVCRRDWTGEQCEIPLSSCANHPCGPNAECRMLNVKDFSQDYVCICDNHQTYGRNCQQTVPNPCLTSLKQFHPFAFSRQAYINCDDEVIFFQPCNALLYWNQEGQRCDRSLPDLLRTPLTQFRTQNAQNFQVQSNIIQSNQRQNDAIMQQFLNSQFGRDQLWQQRLMQENQQQQQQNFPTVPQDLNTQAWSNQIVNTQTQPNQRFNTQSQPWQEVQLIQKQPLFQETTTMPPRMFHLQGFFAPKSQQEQSQQLNDANSQLQASKDVKTQFIGQPQAQSGQLATPLETAAFTNKGNIVRTLFGWQSNQQGSSR